MACAVFAIAYVCQLVPHAHGAALTDRTHPGTEQRGHHGHHPDSHHDHGHAHDHHTPPPGQKTGAPEQPHHHHALTWHIDLHSLRVQPPVVELALCAALAAGIDFGAVSAARSLPIEHWNPPPGYTPASHLAPRGPPALT